MSILSLNLRTQRRFNRCCLAALLGVLSVGFLMSSVADGDLPILGEHAAFNIDKEVKIGKSVYDQLLSRGLVETHGLLNRYINDLGARLLSTLDNRARDYHFFIVRDGSINAFALPGGYIGINVGLILKAQTQHQLASVMAHEIAHVRLMHGIKLMEKSRSTGNAVLLTILAGLLAGGSSDLGAALVYGGAASGQQAMINYTRDFEYEADRLGIDLLQSADFDGRGMVEFFQLLGQASGGSELQNIEYLRTHPVSNNRISETESRLLPMSKKSTGPDYFPLFQDYLLYSASDGALPGRGEFRQALSKIKRGEELAANTSLKALYNNDSDNFWYGYAYAENLEFLKKPDEAEAIYRQLLEIYPDDFIISQKLMQMLKESGRFNQALVIGRRLENRYPGDKSVFFELADLYRQLNLNLLEMLAQADYHRLSGSTDLAIKLYSKVLSLPDIDLATESRVREKLAKLSR